ncbi:MAG: hypothetical protein ABEK01_02480 [Candidatus Nanohaloarchaea archaeon]
MRADPLGLFDVLTGSLLLFTVSALPDQVAAVHALFLISKGLLTVIKPDVMPHAMLVLGGVADLMSAAILYFGIPPVLVGFQAWIAGVLFTKGVWSTLGMMG